MPTISEKQHDFATILADRVARTSSSRNALWNLTGSVGAGKTTTLQLIQQSLWDRSLIPIMVSAPQAETDAGPIALLDVADQLKIAHLLNGERDILNDPRKHWDEKMAAIATAINKKSNSVVILCDEPTLWHRTPQASLEDTPEYCARSFADWIAKEATCRRIISGWVDSDVPVLDRPHAPRLDDGRAFLAEPGKWYSARDLANSLWNEFDRELQERTPWEMKLYVALVRFKGPRVVAQQSLKDESVLSLLRELLDHIEGEENKTMREGLIRLAIARTYVRQQTFNELTKELTQLDRDLILSCLCVHEGEKIALHPLLRRDVVNRSRDSQQFEKNKLWRLNLAERRSTHQRLQHEYTSDTTPAFRDQLEWLRHELLGGAGLPDPVDERLRFVEQLHELGRTLSYVFREHQRAVDVFSLALQLDPDHPYSHHYFAFNLDWLAQQAHNVEAHYQKAIELQPTHPWWWSRWVSYLATRGRFREARSVWRSALDALSVNEEGSPEWIYLSLHRWVARWLLHWAELDFAEDVLRSIPSSLADQDASIQSLWNLFRALRIAEQGPAVFPLTVPHSEWWTAKGHTGLPSTWKDRQMQFWKPARIESIDERSGQIFIIVAEQSTDEHKPLQYCDQELSRAQVERAAHGFSWVDLEEGRFIELAYFGSDNYLRIGLHRAMENRDPHLIPLVPPPDRWYRQVIDAAWNSTRAGA